MQSGLIKGQAFAYFTITGKGSAQEIIEQYQLKPSETWNAGDVDEGCYLYEQMCLLYKSQVDSDQPLEKHLQSLLMRTFRFTEIPDDLVRTLHCVTYEYHSQAGGYYISSEHMRSLARLKAAIRVHAYKMEVEDNHEHPYTKRLVPKDPRFSGYIPEEDDDANDTGEYAYFFASSDTLSTDEISAILQLEPSESWSVGNPRRESTLKWQWTKWQLNSDLTKGQPIAEHLAVLMAKLTPHIDQLYALSRNYEVSFGLSSTGTFPKSHQMYLSKELILQMAKLNLSFDCDLYFHYDE